MDELPDWEPGTAAVLAVSGPRAIPVSTAVRIAPDRIAFALARTRETLSRLRDDPRAALCLFAPGVCLTAYGRVTVVREAMDSSDRVAALELVVERVQDHLEGARTAIHDAVRWSWTEQEAAEADRAIREELAALG